MFATPRNKSERQGAEAAEECKPSHVNRIIYSNRLLVNAPRSVAMASLLPIDLPDPNPDWRFCGLVYIRNGHRKRPGYRLVRGDYCNAPARCRPIRWNWSW